MKLLATPMAAMPILRTKGGHTATGPKDYAEVAVDTLDADQSGNAAGPAEDLKMGKLAFRSFRLQPGVW